MGLLVALLPLNLECVGCGGEKATCLFILEFFGSIEITFESGNHYILSLDRKKIVIFRGPGL
jgi:hypothetical protein